MKKFHGKNANFYLVYGESLRSAAEKGGEREEKRMFFSSDEEHWPNEETFFEDDISIIECFHFVSHVLLEPKPPSFGLQF